MVRSIIMKAWKGRVIRIREMGGPSSPEPQILAYLACEVDQIPAPGQYVQVISCDFSSAWVDRSALASPLFPTTLFEPAITAGDPPGFWVVSPGGVPILPGAELILRGPLGRGFHLSTSTRRLGIAALGDQLARLLPVIDQVLQAGGEAALYSDLPLPAGLPPAVEVYPLEAFPDVFTWADELVLDLPLSTVDSLRESLKLPPGGALPCPGQAFVEVLMPCGGIASCGACAVRTAQGWSQACDQGPVFDLARLLR